MKKIFVILFCIPICSLAQYGTSTYVPTFTFHPNFDAIQSQLAQRQNAYNQNLKLILNNYDSSSKLAVFVNEQNIAKYKTYDEDIENRVGDYLRNSDLSQYPNVQQCLNVIWSWTNDSTLMYELFFDKLFYGVMKENPYNRPQEVLKEQGNAVFDRLRNIDCHDINKLLDMDLFKK